MNPMFPEASRELLKFAAQFSAWSLFHWFGRQTSKLRVRADGSFISSCVRYSVSFRRDTSDMMSLALAADSARCNPLSNGMASWCRG